MTIKINIEKNPGSCILGPDKKPFDKGYSASIDTTEVTNEIKSGMGVLYADALKSARKGAKTLYNDMLKQTEKGWNKLYPIIAADINKSANDAAKAMAKPLSKAAKCIAGAVLIGTTLIAAAIYFKPMDSGHEVHRSKLEQKMDVPEDASVNKREKTYSNCSNFNNTTNNYPFKENKEERARNF